MLLNIHHSNVEEGIMANGKAWPVFLSSAPRVKSTGVGWSPRTSWNLDLGTLCAPVFPGPVFGKPGNPGDHRT